MIDLSTISTAELVAELKTRHELCPVLDEMTRDPMCLFVTTTESLVKELSKRDGVEYADIECEDGIAITSTDYIKYSIFTNKSG